MTAPRPRRPPIAAVVPTVLAAGCDPILNVYGSFFPAWAVCLLLGVVGAALLRVGFAATGLEEGFAPVLLVYPALAFVIACGAWLALFRS
jgi:hypothetical protein